MNLHCVCRILADLDWRMRQSRNEKKYNHVKSTLTGSVPGSSPAAADSGGPAIPQKMQVVILSPGAVLESTVGKLSQLSAQPSPRG